MQKLQEIQTNLDRILEDAHPHRRAVIYVATHFDARISRLDQAMLCFIVARTEEGRPFISQGTMAAALGISPAVARESVRRLRWCGYVDLRFERDEGPKATVYRVTMPHESRFDRPIPQKPRLKEIPEVSREVAISRGHDVASHHDLTKLIARMEGSAKARA